MSFKHRFAIFILNLISKTWRYEIHGNVPNCPAVIAFWHGTMLPIWKFFDKKNAFAVVSLSKDGEILTQLLKKWKFTVLRGSSSRNGKEVLQDMIELAPKGYLLITPDGPQGPIYRMKAGAVITSQRAEIPLVLAGIKVKNKIILNSWDRFYLVMPFAKIILDFSNEYNFKKDFSKQEIDEKISLLEIELNQLNRISI